MITLPPGTSVFVCGTLISFAIPRACEPLYCPRCGEEWGGGCSCSYEECMEAKLDDPYCQVSGAKVRDCGCEYCR